MARDLMTALRQMFGLETEPEPEEPSREQASIIRRQDVQNDQIKAMIDAQIAAHVDRNHVPRRRR